MNIILAWTYFQNFLMPIIYHKHGQTIVDKRYLRYNVLKILFFGQKYSTVSEKNLYQKFKDLYETILGGNMKNQSVT